MDGLYLIIAMGAAIWLLIAAIRLHNGGEQTRSPFAPRSPAEFHRKYGDKVPF